MVARPTIAEVLEGFLAERHRPTKARPYTVRRSIVELLESHMDGYAYDSLTPDEEEMWRSRWEKDEEANPFSRTFGPKRILGQIEPFLGWFLIRKVLGGPEIAENAGPIVLELLEWLESKGHVRPGHALEEAFSSILYDLTQSEPLGTVLEDRDIDYDIVTISRVEGDSLWFTDPEGDEIGPLVVPEAASALASPGWEVSATHFVRTAAAWHLIELGNVYPR